MFKISWPEGLDQTLKQLLKSDLDSLPFAKLASAVLQVSDLFIEGHKTKAAKTPWPEDELSRAYLSYFFPLNTLRVMRVLDEAKNRGFLKGIDHVMDIGSGPGTAQLAFSLMGLGDLRFENFEPAFAAKKIHSGWNSRAKFIDKLPALPKDNQSLYVLSYSLNEMSEWPAALDSAEALMIIEPSTSVQGRQLMAVRQQLIDKGFHIWAPCTHPMACPLLTKTKTDWCHHRFPIDKPQWFEKLENHLPMKNDTLTVSYLLARKMDPLKVRSTFSGRVIGDTLYEKGKVRQMICRRDEREFLSYLTREGSWDGLPNGSLIELPEGLTQKASEIRLQKADLDKLVPSP